MSALVIIGDLIRSSDIASDSRSSVHSDLLEALCTISREVEIYRGDSFQLLLDSHDAIIHNVVSLKSAERCFRLCGYRGRDEKN